MGNSLIREQPQPRACNRFTEPTVSSGSLGYEERARIAIVAWVRFAEKVAGSSVGNSVAARRRVETPGI